MKNLFLLSLITLLVACGSGSGSGNNDGTVTPPEAKPSPQPTPEPSPEPFVPENSSISSLSLVDAQGTPLANAMVEVSPQAEADSSAFAFMALDSQILTTDENGNLVLSELAPGTYRVTVTLAGVTVFTTLEIRPDNASENTALALPIVVLESDSGEINTESLQGQGIFASLNGVIYSAGGVLANAQIEISGGIETNGAIATALTNERGEFSLIINVALNKLLAVRDATIRIVREGFQPLVIPFNLADIANATTVTALTGLNYLLLPQTEITDVLYQEDFEQLADTAVCGMWVAASFGDDLGPDIPLEDDDLIPFAMMTADDSEDDSLSLTNLWHSHGQGLAIVNQAVVENLVMLAPDDQSNGLVPDPNDNLACWYGQAEGGNIGQGNFLGDFGNTNGGQELDGGESDSANGGAIVSPLIDLTNASAPLALTLNTWWEIESVNPNENGFDLMAISVSTDNGETWEDLARLNPLSDPVGTDDVDRAPLPYSNRGYNRAPAWLALEPISLSEFAGQQIRLRIGFATQDEFYNGFRGWLVDDIAIFNGEGTFPRYQNPEEVEDFDNYITSDLGSFSQLNSTLSYSGLLVADEAVTLQLIAYNEVGKENVLLEQLVEPGGFNLSADYALNGSVYTIFAARVIVDQNLVLESVIDIYSELSDNSDLPDIGDTPM
ncbi:hypothetical protein [Bacterioplanoides sp.]|uniref:hypothetical protein n=1 Tax=Bacterioplanoides sp. TaxID=2066072 RepID=UPI003AFFE86E